MRITASTDGDIILVLVGNIINQINLVPKIVAITSDGGTNLEICKAILESNFDRTGVFDLEKPMFVMDCLAYVLDDAFKEGVMDMKYDDGRVCTEVNSRNMQC